MKKHSGGKIYHEIKQKILDGEYAPAQRLIEANLAQDFGVGRYKVRAALDRLQVDGLVQIEPNRGATVKSLELAEVLDILIAREALEAAVTSLAAERIDPGQLAQLAECLDIMGDALHREEFELYSATNKRFHQVIYEASGNQTLPELIISLRQRLTRLQLRSILIPGRSEKSLAEHEAILAALQSRDAAAAEKAARAHQRGLRKAIEKTWQLVRL